MSTDYIGSGAPSFALRANSGDFVFVEADRIYWSAREASYFSTPSALPRSPAAYAPLADTFPRRPA
jgi:hypothetical protein